jgi:predicted DNA-binding transcriptional regulator YafY
MKCVEPRFRLLYALARRHDFVERETLRNEIGAHTRTFDRLVAELRLCGVPIESSRGIGGQAFFRLESTDVRKWYGMWEAE